MFQRDLQGTVTRFALVQMWRRYWSAVSVIALLDPHPIAPQDSDLLKLYLAP